MKKKKGVSPVVSTILLIMIVIILAIIILLWANSFVGEAIVKTIDSKQKTVEQWCQEIDLSPEIDETNFGFTNTGNVPIYQYELKLLQAGGDSETILIKSEEGGSVNPGFTSIIDSSANTQIEDYDSYESIKIIPILLGDGTRDTGKKESKCPEKFAIKLK